MTRNKATSLISLCSIVTGFGLLAAGCGDNEKPERLDEVPFGCKPVDSSFAIDIADVSAIAADDIDLDGNGKPDNALGRAHDLVTGFAPAFDAKDRFGLKLPHLSWTVKVAECNGEVRVSMFETENGSPQFHSAVGTVSATGEIHAEDGNGRVPLLALADAAGTISDPGWRVGDLMTINAVRHGDELEGTFAMSLPTRMVKSDLAAPIAGFLNLQASDDTLRSMADANRDGTVTAEEVAATTTYQGMTEADLDLTIADEPQTSIAFRFHATAMR